MSPTVAASETGLGAYTVAEFGRLFKLSRPMLYKLRRTGQLKFVKVGSRSLITIAEARRFQVALESDSR